MRMGLLATTAHIRREVTNILALSGAGSEALAG